MIITAYVYETMVTHNLNVTVKYLSRPSSLNRLRDYWTLLLLTKNIKNLSSFISFL